MKITEEVVEKAVHEWCAYTECGNDRHTAMRRALEAALSAAPQQDGVEVRVAVAMTPNGKYWSAYGRARWSDRVVMDEACGASDLMQPAGYLVGRIVPPGLPEIAASVETPDA